MSARQDFERATDAAREQVTVAREALAASRAARGGGAAKNAREAEEQLHALRRSVGEDARALRDRLVHLEPSARQRVTTAALAGAGVLATTVGAGLLARSKVRRAVAQRGVQRQALALAQALVGETLRVTSAPHSDGGRGRPRRKGTAVTVLAIAAAAAGAAVLQQRRSPVDDADLWLPEQDLGPA